MFPKQCPLAPATKSYVHPPILGLFKDKEFLEPSSVEVVSINPPEIFFEFNFGMKHPAKKTFEVRNIQTLPIRVNILSPHTEFFTVSFKETSWIFPGLTIKATVSFFSTEPRHYSDRIRINCFGRSGEHNILLPLSVHPVSPATCEFPSKINWGIIPINKTVDYELPINALEEDDLVFLVTVINCDPDFTVTPQQGVVTKHDKRIDVKLSYTPSRYVTSIFYVHIHIPAISETPFLVQCYVECKPECPEFHVDEKIFTKKPPKISKPDVVTPSVKTKSLNDLDLALMYMDGVNKLLMKRDTNEPNVNELRGPLNWYLEEDYEEFKEHLQYCFWKARCLRRCNDIRMIRDRPVLGESADDINDPERRAQVEMVRGILQDVYESRLKDNAPEYQLGENCPQGTAIRKRLVRDYRTRYDFVSSDRMDDPWFYKLRAINRFVQAGRAILLINRLLKNLEILKKLTPADIEAIEQQHELSENDTQEKVWRNMYKEKKIKIEERKLAEAKILEEEKLSARSKKDKKDKMERKVKKEKRKKSMI